MISRLAIIVLIGAVVALMLGYSFNDGPADDGVPTIASMEAVGKSGPLDGMEFGGELGPEGKPKDVADVFVFSNGTFVSKECELRCDYPARPYFINETEDGIEFVSNTKCPFKDAEITWHGTVRDNRISGTAVWTMQRWYWTVTNTFAFEGKLNEKGDQVATAD